MTLVAKLFRLSALLLLAIAFSAHAQVVGGTISGTVHDASGASLVGATVVVRQAETGAARQLTTDAEGRFYAPSVPVGPYSVSVAKDSFESQTQSNLSLSVGQTLQVSFALGVAAVQQQVVVDASATEVNTTTQQSSGPCR